MVASPHDGGLRLDADGGAWVTLMPLLPLVSAEVTDPDDLIGSLAAHASYPVPTALLLVRRGGFAVGVADGPVLGRSKVGTRYVQSRTAAGGWSQQRFARRREGQAKELVRGAAEAWSTVAAAAPEVTPAVLVTGGDRALCGAVLDQPQTRDLRALGTARHLDVPDPRLSVLQEAAVRAQSLLVTVVEPGPT